MTTFSRVVLGLINIILILTVIVGIAVMYNQAEELHDLKTELSAFERRITQKLDDLNKSVTNKIKSPMGKPTRAPANVPGNIQSQPSPKQIKEPNTATTNQ